MHRVELLGPVRAVADDEVIELGSPTQALLLVALACARPHSISTAALIDVVWPDAAPPSARNSLASHLSRLRGRLGDGSIERDGDGYRLMRTTDVDDLDERLGDDDPESLRATLARWRADPAEAWGEHPALRPRADELEDLRTALRRRRSELLVDAGRLDEALAELRSLTVDRPTDERAWADLVSVSSAAGQRTEALRAAQAARLALAAVGLDDDPALLAAERAALAGRSRRTPRPIGPLLGRRDDLARLLDQTASARWTTLVGPGGVGKTRLAIEVAAEAERRGEVVVCDIGAGPEREVLATIARSVGGPLLPDPVERIRHGIGDRELLLVLDGCEQRIAVLGHLADHLGVLPHLRTLATSRRPLGIDGEEIAELHPLEPAAAHELFVGTTRRLGEHPPGDELVEVICERVDRLPLAIEMAAGQLRLMEADELHRRLDHPTALLGGSAEAGRPSLTATIDRSLELLREADVRVLARLSVFEGPFTLDRAEAVVGWGAIGRSEVATAVGALRDVSLVSPVQSLSGRRLRLLDTVRAHAADLLALTGEGDDQLARHGRAHAELAEQIEAGIVGGEEAWWATVAEAELPDLGAAFRAALDRRDLEVAARIPAALFQFAYDRARPEVAAWAVELLDDSSLPVAHRDRLLAVSALGAFQHGEFDRSESLAQQVDDDPLARRRALIMRANVALVRGEPTAAADLAGRALAGADPYLTGLSSLLVAVSASYAGDRERAERAAVELDRLATAPDVAPTVAAYAAYVRGELAAETDPTAAMAHLETAIARAEAVGSVVSEGVARVTANTLAATAGDPQEAVVSFRRTIEHWAGRTDRYRLWVTVRNLVVASTRAGHTELAARLLGAVETNAPAAYGPEAERLDATAASLADALGETRLDQLIIEGRALGLDDVVALVVGTAD
ncbi:MAG: BTAD domain-containing putative transcriptional regulator [Actinomycetota bacterium]